MPQMNESKTRRYQHAVQVLLTFINKVESIQFAFNRFPLERHCIPKVCVLMQCPLLTSTHDYCNVVHTKYLGSLLQSPVESYLHIYELQFCATYLYVVPQSSH